MSLTMAPSRETERLSSFGEPYVLVSKSKMAMALGCLRLRASVISLDP